MGASSTPILLASRRFPQAIEPPFPTFMASRKSRTIATMTTFCGIQPPAVGGCQGHWCYSPHPTASWVFSPGAPRAPIVRWPIAVFTRKRWWGYALGSPARRLVFQRLSFKTDRCQKCAIPSFHTTISRSSIRSQALHPSRHHTRLSCQRRMARSPPELSDIGMSPVECPIPLTGFRELCWIWQ